MFKTIHSKLTLLHALTFGVLLVSVVLILYFSLAYILNDFFDKNLYNGAKNLEYSIFHPPEKKDIVQRLRRDFGDVFTEAEFKKAELVINKMSGMRHRFMIQERLDFKMERVFFFGPVFVQVREVPAVDITASIPSLPSIVARSDSMKGREIPLSVETYGRLLDGETVYDFFRWKTRKPLRGISFMVTDTDNNRYIMQLAMGSSEIKEMIHRLRTFNLVIVPFILLIMSVGGYFFVKRTFKPVKKIVRTVNSITSEDLSLRVESTGGGDEIGDLIDTFNRMIERLEGSFKSIKEFSGNASHELKTPLTVIRGEIEVALRKDRDTAEYKEILNTIQSETHNLQAIVDDLLFLSRLEGGSVGFKRNEVEMDSLFLETYEKYLPQAKDKNITVSLTRMEALTLTGNAVLLKRLLANLIQNAIKYTPENGRIDLALFKQEGKTTLTVADTGIGIPAEHLPHIFDSFYRVEHTREDETTNTTGGAGLGLAIVKKIIEVHDGEIKVDSEENIGSTFTVTF